VPDGESTASAHSYEVLGKLAEGGMTEIFLARARGAGAVERFVVLKRLKRSVTTHVDLVKHFLDEARLASQLQHPNVAQVFEVGKLGGSYFFAMEFVNGETLQSLMLHARARKIQIPVRAVLTIAAAMAAGLHHAHDRKGTDGAPLHIVHGDISPTNTLVSQEGIVKLVDFGITRAGEPTAARISPYASPEQCNGAPLDRRSDLFSLGTVLWELLTLDGLYHGASDDDVKHAIETTTPSPPSARRYDVPAELDAMVTKLLASSPDDRYQDADELLAAIEALAQKLGILLSTADLSRMMRLWFGTKSDPAVDETEPDVTPLVVASEEIPDDLAVPVESPIDHQLEAVRDAAALIVARATERSGSPTGRQDKPPTVPPELMDNPHENFEQIRDRILERARKKKETLRNQIVGGDAASATSPASAASPASPASPASAASPATAASLAGDAAAAAAGAAATGAGGSAAETPSTRHARTTAQAPIGVLEDAMRRAGLIEPADVHDASDGHANGASPTPSRRSAKGTGVPYTADKVIVDEEIRGTRSVSGELDSTEADRAKLETAKTYAAAAAARIDAAMAAAGDDDDDGHDVGHDAGTHGNHDHPGNEHAARGDRGDKFDAVAAAAARGDLPREAPAANANIATPAASPSVTSTSMATSAAAEKKRPGTLEVKGEIARGEIDASPRRKRASTDGKGEGELRDAGGGAAGRESKDAHDTAATRDSADARDSAGARETRDARDSRDSRDSRNMRNTRDSDAERAARSRREADEERERAEATATARASTAEILRRPPPRPSWPVPVLGASVLVVLLLIVVKLRSASEHAPTKTSDTVATSGSAAASGAANAIATAPPAGSAGGGSATASGAPATAAANASAAAGSAAANGSATAPDGASANGSATAPDSGAANGSAAEAGRVGDPNGPSGTPSPSNAVKEPEPTRESAPDSAPTHDSAPAQNSAPKQQSALTHESTPTQDSTPTRAAAPEHEGPAKREAAPKHESAPKHEAPAKREPKKGIEELYQEGNFAQTNTACAQEVVFTPTKLDLCARAACQTRNAALAKRWTNAIAKASRPPIVELCRSFDIELEPAPTTSPPSSSAPSSPPR